jgi:seryl-tRNA synthetase
VKTLDAELDGHWQKVVTELTKLQRKSDSTSQEMHTTLNEIIKKIKEILKNIKKERDQFLAIKQTYNSVNIEGILAQQRLAWTALEQKRAELQIALSNKQKKFREEANFCKVSFREYDEQVCDITKYVQKY